MKTTKIFRTNYSVAVNWLNNDLILCNEIQNLDPSIFDNAHFGFFYYTDEDGNEYESENEYDGEGELEEHCREIYQYYLTNCTKSDVEYLEKFFPELLFTYSDLLGLYVLCVDHWGTGWDYVRTDTTIENAQREEGEKK